MDIGTRDGDLVRAAVPDPERLPRCGAAVEGAVADRRAEADIARERNGGAFAAAADIKDVAVVDGRIRPPDLHTENPVRSRSAAADVPDARIVEDRIIAAEDDAAKPHV